MTVQQIIDLSLSLAHTKESQVGSANVLSWFNIARKRIGSLITQNVDENYFASEWFIDAVADQADGKYDLPDADQDSEGIVKIDRVLIKGYNTDTYYEPCNEIKLGELPLDWTWYLNNRPKSHPVYRLGATSIFIAPKFVEADITDADGTVITNNNQIELHGTKKLIDLAADASDDTILIPDDVQWAIAEFIVPLILRSRGKKSEASDLNNALPGVAAEVISTLTNRTRDFMEAKVPRESEYGYEEMKYSDWY